MTQSHRECSPLNRLVHTLTAVELPAGSGAIVSALQDISAGNSCAMTGKSLTGLSTICQKQQKERLSMTDNNLMTAALEYARRGWAVFPLCSGEKKPVTAQGFKDATTNEKQIREWWTMYPAANIGIATGPASGGLLVIDIDNHGRKNGHAELKEWEMEHGPLPVTLSAKTTTSESYEHLYFSYSGMNLRSRLYVRSDIDLRAANDYVIAPPSIYHGNRFTWENPNTPISAVNDNVLYFLKKKPYRQRATE